MQQIPRLQCRGEDTRRQICKKYRIIPKAHFRILNGVSIHSDAGDTMTEEYFIFDAVDKNDITHVCNIYCGVSVAKSFARLAGITLPPIYNPLKSTSNSGVSRTHSSTVHQSAPKWNTERKQLYDVVMLTMMYLGDIRTDSALFRIKSELENPDFIDYYPRKQIHSVNTTLKNLNLTFEDVLNELSKENNLKAIEYDKIRDYMIKNHLDEQITSKKS